MCRPFMIRNLAICRWRVLLTCLFLALAAIPNGFAQDGNVNMHEGNVQVSEVRKGPYRVDGRDFTLVKKVLRWEGAVKGFDETVQSILIIDHREHTHYQKSFVVDQGDTAFMESIDVSAFVLDSYGLRGFRVEGGVLKKLPQRDKPGAGLIVYYDVVPSAPMSGVACQVFALKGNRLTPLFSPLTVYGRIHELPPGSTADSRRLFENDTMRFGVWTGWFEVIVPLKVFDNLSVVPLHYDMTSRHYALDVIVERQPSAEDTFVRLFSNPSETEIPRHVIIRKGSKVECLWAYARPVVNRGVVTLDGPPWLKVRIDGREGYVRAPEDLMALGLRQAG